MNNPSQPDDELRQLFQKHVPEVAAGVVELVSIAREPGKHVMAAVRSRDESLDPISACVGTRGIQVKNICRDLAGEKVTIVLWNKSPETFIVNALSGVISVRGPVRTPAVILDTSGHRAILNVDRKTLEHFANENTIKLRLVSKLVGWEIELGCRES